MHSVSIVVPPAVKPGEYVYTEASGSRAFREHERAHERNAVVAIVEHWQDDCFLVLSRKDGLRAFITETIEGASIVRTARTKIAQEVGYIGVSLEHILNDRVHDKFYDEDSSENRFIHSTIVVCKLESGIREDCPRSPHVPEWVDANRVKSFLNLESHRRAWQLFLDHTGRA